MRRKDHDHTLETWPAISDLFAGLVIILAIVMMITYKELKAFKDSGLSVQDFYELKIKYEKLSYNYIELEKEKEKIKKERDELRKIIGVKGQVIAQLKEELKKQGIDSEINERGNLDIKSDLLFELQDERISQGRQEGARKIGRAIFDVLKNKDYKKSIATVMVVGHSDQSGSWSYNYHLSSRRAANLVKLWGEDLSYPSEKNIGNDCVLAKIIASGIGEARPKITPELPDVCGNKIGEEGCAKNRRIEFLIIPKEESHKEVFGCD